MYTSLCNKEPRWCARTNSDGKKGDGEKAREEGEKNSRYDIKFRNKFKQAPVDAHALREINFYFRRRSRERVKNLEHRIYT